MALATYMHDNCHGDLGEVKQYDSDDMDSHMKDIINGYGCKSVQPPEDDDFDFGLNYDWSKCQDKEHSIAGPGHIWLKDTIHDLR